METQKKEPTIADVSAACGGIHRNTVSKILKGQYKGSPDTIEKVKAAAEALGYSIDGANPTAPKPAPRTAKEIVGVKDEDLPEGVKLYEPNQSLSKGHKWTLEFSVEVACEWEYDKDDKGNIIEETGKVVATEMRQCYQCLPTRPSLREIELYMAQHRAKFPDAV